jgi:transposase-like protein
LGEPKSRRQYDRKFKEGAVWLVIDEDRTLRGVAWDLGIRRILRLSVAWLEPEA